MRLKGVFRRTVLAGLASALGACATAPDYVKPALEIPVSWQVEAPWRATTPGDTIAKGNW